MYRRFVRTTVVALIGCWMLSGSPRSSQHEIGIADSQSAKLSPEVRLRKLHLVRPDLIPFPVTYEIYC